MGKIKHILASIDHIELEIIQHEKQFARNPNSPMLIKGKASMQARINHLKHQLQTFGRGDVYELTIKGHKDPYILTSAEVDIEEYMAKFRPQDIYNLKKLKTGFPVIQGSTINHKSL